MSADQKFETYLSKFEYIELPVTIDETNYEDVNERNVALPDIVVSLFLNRDGSDEDVAEYVPFFRLPDHDDIISLVLWRAGLLKYCYLVATYTKEGVLIDQQEVGKSVYDDKIILKSVVRFENDSCIYVATGQSKASDKYFDPINSRTEVFEIAPDGNIHLNIN